METFPQHWAHSELFTVLMGWALELLSFVVCSVLVVILKQHTWLGRLAYKKQYFQSF